VYAVMLRLEGFSVEGASDGQEALQKAVELLPDIRPVSTIFLASASPMPFSAFSSSAEALQSGQLPRVKLMRTREQN
jgi:hypothetical protein